MAITKTGANLLTQCGAGNFETDPSTWNILVYGHLGVFRSSLKKEGLNSGQFDIYSIDPQIDLNKFARVVWFNPANLIVGKKYILEGWVYVGALTPIGDDTVKILIYSGSVNRQDYAGQPAVAATVGEAKGAWVKIDYPFEVIADNGGGVALHVVYSNHVDYGGSGELYQFSNIYLDAFTLYEFTDGTEEEPPAPTPVDAGSVFFFKNPIPFDVNASPANIDQPNYCLHADVRVENPKGSGTYVSQLKMELEPDAAGVARFFLNEAFRNALAAHVPAANETAIKRVTNAFARFKVYFAEKFGDDPVLQPYQVSDDMLAIMGGVQKEFFPDIDFFETYLPSKKKFLTWQPAVKKVHRLQEEYLYYYVFDATNVTTLNLFVKIYYDDEANTEATIMLGSAGAPATPVVQQEIFCFPVGYVHGGIQAKGPNPELAVKKYDVWLEDDLGGAVSEIRTYIVDATPAPYARYFLFLNSLGGMDTLRTVGKTSKSFESESDTHEQILETGYSLETGQYKRSFAMFYNAQEVSTGHITKKQADYLQDLLISGVVYEITSGKRVPVIIDTKSFRIFEDGEFRYFLRFKFRSAYNNEVYTPDNYSEL